MAWGKSNEHWNHTASMMTLLASIYSDPDSPRRPSVADYHPYMEAPETPTASPEMVSAIMAQLRGRGPEVGK